MSFIKPNTKFDDTVISYRDKAIIVHLLVDARFLHTQKIPKHTYTHTQVKDRTANNHYKVKRDTACCQNYLLRLIIPLATKT